jgi:uncharacterized membrane protein
MAKSNITLQKALPWILVVGGIIGIICSSVLIYDQVKIWQNPNYVPFCSLNPVVSCGSVINSKQGEVFGIPPPFFGLIVFPALATVGVAMLAGSKFKRWFWLALELGAVGGAGFALWLFLLSVYRVHALCPFCLTVDVVTYTLFWYLSLYVIDNKYLRRPRGHAQKIYNWVRRHHLDLLIAWFILLIAFILKHFWYYYGKHL